MLFNYTKGSVSAKLLLRMLQSSKTSLRLVRQFSICRSIPISAVVAKSLFACRFKLSNLFCFSIHVFVTQAAVGDLPVQHVCFSSTINFALFRLADSCDRWQPDTVSACALVSRGCWEVTPHPPPGQRWPVWKLTLLHCCPVRRAAESKRSSSQSKVAAVIRRRPLVRHCDIACWMTIIQASCVDRQGAPECQPAYDFYSRCFVPWAGVTEDPVTGKNFRYYGHQEIISEWFLTP